jgi:hypothetical protein
MNDEPLTIRSEQLDALASAGVDEFVERARVALGLVATAGSGSARARQDDEARAWIRRGIERAQSYEIRSERDVVAFLRVMSRCGDDFDREPWAQVILDGERVHAGMSKAQLLFHTAEERA